MATKISEGIRYAIEQARQEQQEKTGHATESNPAHLKLGSLLRQAATNIREKGVDVRISDLQNLESIFRGQ